MTSYAECVGMTLLGWRYPLRESLEARIDRSRCYPVSVINMKAQTLYMLLRNGIVTVLDVPESPQRLVDNTGISISNARRIVELAGYAKD